MRLTWKRVKYGLAIVTAMALFVGTIGCSNNDTTSDSSSKSNSQTPIVAPGMSLLPFESFGAAVQVPQKYMDEERIDPTFIDGDGIDLWMYSDAYHELFEEMSKIPEEDMSPELLTEYTDKAKRFSAPLLELRRYPEDEKKSPQELTGSENATEIGRQEGFVYTIHQPDFDSSVLDSEILPLYEETKKSLPEIRKSAQLIPIDTGTVEYAEDALPTFSTTDVNGNPVTKDIFKGHKVTMINLWGTFCGPCIQEMPDLGELANNMPDGTQLIGMVSDVRVDQDENLSFAQDILKKSKATFPNLKIDDGLKPYMDSVGAFPTTIFVDENGKFLGDPIIGSRSTEEYLEELAQHLK